MPEDSSTLVISHWYKLIENLQASPKEFYSSVEQSLENRQIPNTERSRIDWKEAGAFSAAREYLRIQRGNYIFDICGAPFGTGFFFSWWLGEARPSPILPAIGLLAAVAVVWSQAGLFFTIAALVALFIIVGVLISLSPEEESVSYALVMPILGPLWEKFFRPATYYRIDTALMFQQAVHAAVLEVIDGLTTAKGIRALSESERKPILKDFFQR